jgi:hypothetical protein
MSQTSPYESFLFSLESVLDKAHDVFLAYLILGLAAAELMARMMWQTVPGCSAKE